MKLIFIRHAKVNCPIPKLCDAQGFDKARADYDISPIHPVTQRLNASKYNASHFRFYVSTLQRTHDTLQGRIGDVPYTETDLLTEVPNRSIAGWRVKLPYPFWQAAGRVQWFFNAGRQPEGRAKTTHRARQLVSALIKRNEDCVLISHEFYLYTLMRVLRQNGFRVRRSRHGRIRNLEMIVAVK